MIKKKKKTDYNNQCNSPVSLHIFLNRGEVGWAVAPDAELLRTRVRGGTTARGDNRGDEGTTAGGIASLVIMVPFRDCVSGSDLKMELQI